MWASDLTLQTIMYLQLAQRPTQILEHFVYVMPHGELPQCQFNSPALSRIPSPNLQTVTLSAIALSLQCI